MMNSNRWFAGWMHLLAFAVAFVVFGCNRGRSLVPEEDAQASAEEAVQGDVSSVSSVVIPEDGAEEDIESIQTQSSTPDSSARPQGVIALETRWEGGVLTMPCKVNGLRLRFIFDTGASDVCISATEAIFMLKNDYLKEEDIGGSVQYAIANGDIVDSTAITLREVEVGGIVLKDVKASVSHEIDAPLLFGQSAIHQLGTIQIRDGEVVILPGGEQQMLVDSDGISSEDAGNHYNQDEYKQNGWLVESNGTWYLADNAPIDAKLRFYRSEALQWNDATKMMALAELYADGVGVAQDFSEAFKWYHLAGENGNAVGQYNTGVYYNSGRGVRQDQAEARRWYAMAAAQGYVYAQYNLGVMYDDGEGGKPDKTEAVKWYRRAAEQGFAAAQFILAVKFDDGEGVVKNKQQALYWYQKAAKQGHTHVLNNLAVMYENGIGVAKTSARH